LIAKLEAGKHEAARLAASNAPKINLEMKLTQFENKTGTGKKKISKKKH